MLQFPNVDTTLDELHDVHRQVMEVMDQGDALHREEVLEDAVPDNEDVAIETLDGLEELYDQAMTTLYTGAHTNIVSGTFVLMTMCVVFKVSNKFTDELLKYLSEDLVPTGNKLPGTHYTGRKMIRRLGLDYNNLHAYPDGCVLYEDENALLNNCPKCTKSRWLEGSSTISTKVI